VGLLLTSQAQNPMKAWRYGPSSRDADTTVSGACFVALIAAANAGIKVPDKAIKDALAYYARCQSADGGFGYTGPGGSDLPRSAIGTLVYSLARKTRSNVYKRSFEYIASRDSNQVFNCGYPYYYLYYASQSFFRAKDPRIWDKWNSMNIKRLQATQLPNGAWRGPNGMAFSTATALLSLALNYRFLPIYER